MKKLILLFVVCSMTFMVHGQSILYGPKAGVNISNLVGDDAEGFSSRTSFNVGAVVSIYIADFFRLQPEIVYSTQGFDEGASGTLTDGKMDYINVPVLADYEFAPGLTVQAGPQIGFNLTAEADSGGMTSDLEVDSVDFGAAVGLQYRMETGLFFQGRYNLGLKDINSMDKIKNSVLSFSLGYLFN